jgi:hypothetical protein
VQGLDPTVQGLDLAVPGLDLAAQGLDLAVQGVAALAVQKCPSATGHFRTHDVGTG